MSDDATAVATPEAPRASRRLAGPDVTRAVGLIGVVVMNYHGYLGGSSRTHPSFPERVFDTYDGPLTTRFAAIFVLVAGMGVALLTNRSRSSGDRTLIREDRWRLLRRGVLLYAFGLLIEWIWHGTILFYYGAFFVAGALLFTLATRWLVTVGAVAAVAAAGINWFRIERALDGRDTSWLDPDVTSPRNLLLRTFVGYTHPLLPWLAFLCAGIALGRLLPRIDELRPRLLVIGATMLAVSYAVNFVGLRTLADGDGESAYRWRHLLATGPFERGLLYTIGTLGSSIVAYAAISWAAERWSGGAPVELLRHAGQMTLTLYVLHVLTFNAVVHWWHVVGPTGLDTALVFSLVFWIVAIAFGAWWHRFVGLGPLERIYRSFGG